MPTVQTKLIGFGPDELCNLQSLISNPHSLIPNPQSPILNPQSPITLLVEADGARGLRLKAPSEGEPQVPPCADVVCVLANLDAIGRPLDDRIAHRVNVIARLTQTMPGSIITAPLLATLLAHPEGGLKGIPRTARKVVVLTQHNENAIHPDATGLMQTLVQRGFFDVAATIAPRATQAVLGKVAR
jgi:probable selenium-dependent hydroxylase accessory protein YqeC